MAVVLIVEITEVLDETGYARYREGLCQTWPPPADPISFAAEM
jgi:hypothetical protein